MVLKVKGLEGERSEGESFRRWKVPKVKVSEGEKSRRWKGPEGERCQRWKGPKVNRPKVKSPKGESSKMKCPKVKSPKMKCLWAIKKTNAIYDTFEFEWALKATLFQPLTTKAISTLIKNLQM